MAGRGVTPEFLFRSGAHAAAPTALRSYETESRGSRARPVEAGRSREGGRRGVGNQRLPRPPSGQCRRPPAQSCRPAGSWAQCCHVPRILNVTLDLSTRHIHHIHPIELASSVGSYPGTTHPGVCVSGRNVGFHSPRWHVLCLEHGTALASLLCTAREGPQGTQQSVAGSPQSLFQARICLINYQLVRVRGKPSADSNMMKSVTQNSRDKYLLSPQSNSL